MLVGHVQRAGTNELILLMPMSWRQPNLVILLPLRSRRLEMDWWNKLSIGAIYFVAANYVKEEHFCKVFRLRGNCRLQRA
ncbi:MAG: hypothetical protein CMM07_27165 [Rhodopirellula sp.]|nr:hypothetical protein [Rhodopirellula sp.]